MGDAIERRTTELVDAFLAGRMSRRTFIRGLLALGLSAGTAGAILANASRASAQVASDVAGTVRFYIGPWTADEVANHEVIAEGFRALYPNVDFTFDLYDWGTQSEQTNASLAEGAHDIYYFGEAQLVSRLEQEDGFADITERVNDPAWAEEKAKYLYWDRIDRYGPKLIGLPISWHVEDALFVNMDRLVEAGYGPEFVESWDTFVDAIAKMTKGTDTYGAGLGMQINGFGEWYQRLRSAGGSYLTPDLSAPNVVTPDVALATQQMADLFTNGYAPPLGTFDYNTGPGAFAGGRLATYSSDLTVGPWLASMDPAVPFEWAILPMPPGPVDRLQFNDIGFYAMSSRTPDQDLAWEVLKWWTNPENGAFWTGKSGTYSARADALEHGYTDHALPQLAAVFDQFQAQGVGPEPFKGFQQVEDQAEAQVKRIYAGEIGVDEALANIEAIVVSDVLS
jgi:ABC-type glycerol-3-phosphate transport system substrate-binding protein